MKLLILEVTILCSCIALFLSTEYLALNTDLLTNLSKDLIETAAQQSENIQNESDEQKRREYLSRHNLSAAIYEGITEK